MGVLFGNIVGNQALKERLYEDVSKKTFSHAYIIEGPLGSGRHTLALNIAAALSCIEDGNIPCGNCKSCQKILSGTSPDIVTHGLEGDKVTIGVEQIRKIKEDIVIAPNDLDIKVYIIENADSMTVQAQNAFLLSLEEPPEYVIFLLICESSGALLETVRSRAPVLRLMRLSDSDVEKFVLEHDKRAEQLKNEDKKAFDTVIFASDGCIGRALSLLDTKKRKVLFDERAAAESIINSLQSKNRAEILALLNSFGTKRHEVIRYLSLIQYAVRDLMLIKKTDSARLCFYSQREEAQELSTHYTSSTLSSLYDAAYNAVNELEANANVRLTLLNMAQNAGLI